jgi:hypothetical protein
MLEYYAVKIDNCIIGGSRFDTLFDASQRCMTWLPAGSAITIGVVTSSGSVLEMWTAQFAGGEHENAELQILDSPLLTGAEAARLRLAAIRLTEWHNMRNTENAVPVLSTDRR